MVADAKNQRRQEFGQLLNAAIERHFPDVKPYGRTRWLHQKLKRKGQELVSYESVRKWLNGLDFPDQGNLRELCQRTGIASSELDPQTNKADETGSFTLGELMTLWHASAPEGKAHILSAARLAATGGKSSGGQ